MYMQHITTLEYDASALQTCTAAYDASALQICTAAIEHANQLFLLPFKTEMLCCAQLMWRTTLAQTSKQISTVHKG